MDSNYEIFDETLIYTPVDTTFFTLAFSYDNYWMITDDY
jgi:hypothetical protein